MFSWPHFFGFDALLCRGGQPAVSGSISAFLHAPWALLDDAVEPQPIVVSSGLALAWGDAKPVAAQLAMPWELLSTTADVAGSLQIVWGERLGTSCALPWSAVVAKRLALAWGDAVPCSKRLALSWSMTAPVAAGLALGWDIRRNAEVAAACRLSWSAPGDGQVVDAGVSLLTARGVWLRPRQASVTLAEGSPYWSADITLAAEEDAAQLEQGDGLALAMCGHVFALRVDQPREDAEGPVTRSWQVQALSPLAWLDTPYALAGPVSFPAGTTAREAVEELLAPVATLVWELPDWTLPAAGLAFSSATPMGAARGIVEAIGGLLESRPDGSAVARRRWPVAPAEIAQAVPDMILLDSEAISRSVSRLHVEIVNRLAVGDGSADTAAQDRLEYKASANSMRGTVRAWPSPWRPVRLVHTGRPDVQIEPQGVRTWEVAQTVEFKDGQATLDVPAQALVGVTWRYVDLGSVTLDGNTLTAAFGTGYSLADVRYTTRAYQWAVADDQIEDVQFLLEDDDE